MLKIKEVEKGSLGEEIGLKAGDEILSFNGFDAEDILDYMFYDGEDGFSVTVRQSDGTFTCDVEKDEDETLGLTFENDNLEIKTCHNDCIFCFVAQMPKNMRGSLYVKDDDYRQSVLYGNYVTLTNVSDKDLERIVRLKMSPLYISVQATDGEVRKTMLRNRFADKINKQLKFLSDNGIEMHTQVVLVKGVNDGEILKKTVYDLAALKGVKSLAVVPCGITKYRDGLKKIEDIDGEYSANVIKTLKKINAELDRTFAYAADDFYIRADMDFEPPEYYGDFCQIENGVGMNSKFDEDFKAACRKRSYKRTFLIVTGTASEKFITRYAKKTMSFCEGLKVYVLGIKNEFFGESVTCAGLIVGQDILNAVKKFDKDFDELVIVRSMLKSGEDVFLDDMTVDELSAAIGKPVRINECDGASFFEAITK
ncbi:MAG: DUF512 domain-containing protein [Clostridia bacterium]|nr:DUF512 domain-containing protein [Clostridia bacterium]